MFKDNKNMANQRNIIQSVIFCALIIQTFSTYVFYPDLNRRCIPKLNCEPGNAIQPCMQDHAEDLCTPCPDGMVQPDLISSTGNATETACFIPFGECLAHDITYARYHQERYCSGLKGCKCKLSQCHYGDPCVCYEKDGGCPTGKELDDTGACVDCPYGTEKNDTGCGPCRMVIFTIRGQSKAFTPKILIPTPKLISMDTTTQYEIGSVSITSHERKPFTKSSHSVLIAVIAIFGIIVLILLLVLVLYCIKKPKDRSRDHRTNDAETGHMNENVNQPTEQQALVERQNVEVLQEQKNDSKINTYLDLTSNPKEKEDFNRNRNPSATEEFDSGVSGVNDEDEDPPCNDDVLQDSQSQVDIWDFHSDSKSEDAIMITVYDEKDIREKIRLLQTDPYDSMKLLSSDPKHVNNISLNMSDVEDETAHFNKLNHYLSDNQSPVTTESEPPINFPHSTYYLE